MEQMENENRTRGSSGELERNNERGYCQPKKFHNFAYVAFWQHIALLLHAALGIAIT